MACTRTEILKQIRELIEVGVEHIQEGSFIYHVSNGKIDVLELLAIFTAARHNLLSELMERLAVDGVDKEGVTEVIASIMLGFNKE